MRIRFITSTPLEIRRGSGTYVGISVLASALRRLGHHVEIETRRLRLPVYTLTRLAFNWGLRPSADFDLTVGFDMDGYRLAATDRSHVASLKGVIADEARFERGLARATMRVQAAREREHVQAAGSVLVTSRYSAEQARAFYGLEREPVIVPEPIDLAEWRRLIGESPVESSRFVTLFAGRLYRRKRLDTLLRAAAILRDRIPRFELRIVGDGPHASTYRRLARELRLGCAVSWLGNVPRAALAAEYRRAAVFCLPSVQEAFGIVLLEAMAARKAIVAARAAAIPEVVPHAALVEPEQPEAFAAAIESLYRSPGELAAIAAEGERRVEQFDAANVARLFLAAVSDNAARLTSTAR